MNRVSAVDAIQLKLTRADRHLAEFDALVDAYYERRPIQLDGRFDADASEWVTTIRITEEPPPEFGPVIGDVGHNLRSALDQLTWQLALLQTPMPYQRTQFPIFTDPAAYRDFGASKLQSLAARHAEFIERLQPYHESEPAGSLLYALNKLSNADKHREMHFANSALMGASLSIHGMGGGVGFGGLQLAFGQFEDGSEVARITGVVLDSDGTPPQFGVGIDGAFDFAVTDEAGNGLSVYAGLFATRELVGDVVDWFKPLL